MIPILYNIPHCQTPRDNNGKSNQCASAASCGAARSAVARGEVRPSDFRDRVFERYGSIPQVGTTDPNSVRSFTAENGAGTKSEMGKGSEGTEASSGESENNWLGSCKAHHVASRPQEDRGGAAGAVGEGTGGEEGGVAVIVASPALF